MKSKYFFTFDMFCVTYASSEYIEAAIDVTTALCSLTLYFFNSSYYPKYDESFRIFKETLLKFVGYLRCAMLSVCFRFVKVP